MAKWGEGDPRWIVEQREDGVNVNNWHWREKNCTPWSVQYIQDSFKGFTLLESGSDTVVCTDTVKVDGDVTANNRKNKLIFLYDLELSIGWKGTNGEGLSYSGTIEVPNLSDENDIDELDVNVSVSSDEAEARRLKELVRTKCKKTVQDKLAVFLQALKTDYCSDLILNANKGDQQNTASPAHSKKDGAAAIAVKLSNGVAETVSISKPASSPIAREGTTTISETYEFKCSAEDAYTVLMEPARVQAWVQGPVKIDARPGGEWALFGGNVLGKYIELVPNKKIVQTWRFASWPAESISTVTMVFEQGADSTKLKLTQTGVPKGEADKVRDGWRGNYWRRINSVFGYGADFGSF